MSRIITQALDEQVHSVDAYAMIENGRGKLVEYLHVQSYILAAMLYIQLTGIP
jgi:hypothetical protein